MHRRYLPAIVALAVVCLAISLQAAWASVQLLYFRGQEMDSSTILLTWETATERDVIGFKVYRSTAESPSDWGAEIHAEGSQGGAQTGGSYRYEDRGNVVAGVRYYYLLEEVTNQGAAVEAARTSAGIGLPADTPTPTTSLNPTATRTQAAGATANATTAPSPTSLGPTATRRFTDAPATPVAGTPSPQVGSTVAAPRISTQTPLTGAQVATPTGPAPRVTLPPAVVPTSTPGFVAAVPFTLTDRPTFTPALIAIGAGTPVETPTALPTKDMTPAIFSSETQDADSPSPSGAEQVAGEGTRSTALALAIGGSAIGLAGLLAAALLFLRSRRS